MFLVLPAAVLFATVFTISPMGRHSEITAAKASGVSFFRLARPVFAAAGAAVALGILLGEMAPVGTLRRAELLGNRPVHSTATRSNFVYRADGGWVYAIRALDIGSGLMQDLIMEQEGSGPEFPTIDVAASRATYDTSKKSRVAAAGRCGVAPCATCSGRRGKWRSPSIRCGFARSRSSPSICSPNPRLRTRCATPSWGATSTRWAAPGPIPRSCGSSARSSSRSHSPASWWRCSGRRSSIAGPRSGTAWGVAVGLGTTLVFLVLVQLTKAIGAGGVLPPLVAAWLPNVMFGSAALWLLKKTRT